MTMVETTLQHKRTQFIVPPAPPRPPFAFISMEKTVDFSHQTIKFTPLKLCFNSISGPLLRITLFQVPVLVYFGERTWHDVFLERDGGGVEFGRWVGGGEQMVGGRGREEGQ